MTVPADDAVMTNGRPYARPVVATAVAVRVAKLFPPLITDDAMKEPQEDESRGWSLAWPSPPETPSASALARLFTSFLAHRQFGFHSSKPASTGGSCPRGRGP